MKSALRVVLILLLVNTLLMSTYAVQEIASTARFSENPGTFESARAVSLPNRTVLIQTFDDGTVGAVPKGWTVTSSSSGNFVVDDTVYRGSKGKSAKLLDNSTESSPQPYVTFTGQNGTIVVSFAIRLSNNSGGDTVFEVYVDDGNFKGSNIIFKNGKIGYRAWGSSIVTLRSSYIPERWYSIKIIMNVPKNTYNIHIDDHLEAINAVFTGQCTQIQRIVINETSGPPSLPVGYLDDLDVREGLVIPKDFPTIQEGVNAASPGDTVFVTRQRTYFEQVTIPPTKKGVWLVGEDPQTTTIDGSYAPPGSLSHGILVECDNVLICGFTINSTPYGSGIHIVGANNTIVNNIVTNGLGDGINMDGSGNTVTGNIIRSNLRCGVRISGSNSTVTSNIIESNDRCGVLLNGANATIEDNYVGSSLECGICIASGEYNLVKNNTIRRNALAVQCDPGTKGNRIYQNRFIGNDKKPQAIDNGTNTWDDGYPYAPDNETGGGNYWSDFSCIDLYSGENQNERAKCCLPLPDGICDRPYKLSSEIQDRYALFLIQSVVQNPENVSNIEYDTDVIVTAKILKSVKITSAFLLVDYDSKHQNITMAITDDKLNATITARGYGTQVRYNVSVHAEFAVELNSTDYPIESPYRIGDKKPPTIGQIGWTPTAPNNNQTILFWAVVSEPANASGVDKVSLSYMFGNSVWKAEMGKIAGDNYTAVMPPQPGNATLFFNVSAVDKAGNSAVKSNSTFVNKLPELSISNGTVRSDPCIIDLGVMYRGQNVEDKNITLYNIGQEVLAWKIDLIKDGEWLKKISPNNGTILPNKNTTLTISVDTTSCSDPNLYVAELAVNANGIVPHWGIAIRVEVRDISIDDSWASVQTPQRCDINETQYYGFHAKWTHNCTEAVSGKIKVKVIGWIDVNGTGWANFNHTSFDPAQQTFSVEEVDFIYTKDGQTYHIRSFTQKVSNLTTIWDRVKIALTFVDDRIDVGAQAAISWNESTYEFDGSPFEGTPYLNDTLIKNDVGKYYFTTSNITDDKYGLTKFRGDTVSCIWDRIKIIGGGTSSQQTPVGRNEQVWFIAIYQYDNTLLKGANGTLFLDVYEFAQDTRTWQPKTIGEPMEWSAQNDRWEKSYSFDSQGSRRFAISKVEDRLYSLTVIQDLVGPLEMVWLASGWTAWSIPTNDQPVPVQGGLDMPLWAIASIASTLAVGLIIILIILITSGTKRTSKEAYDSHKR